MKNIIFNPHSEFCEQVCEAPTPATQHVPEWYRTASQFMHESKLPLVSDSSLNATFKKCLPMFDALTAGYMITLPSDIQVSIEGSGVRMNWLQSKVNFVINHPDGQANGFPIPDEYVNSVFKWTNDWIVNTPSGYSSLVVHPSLRLDLPFHTLTAIVDTDKHEIPINFPFLIKRNFEGIIPKGTPIAQIIPIKRDDWVSSKKPYDTKNAYIYDRFINYIEKGYKKLYWTKKSYK